MKRALAILALVSLGCEKSSDEFDYGPSELAVRQLKKKVTASRCEAGAVFDLADVMRRAGNSKGAGAELVAFRKECNKDAHLKLEVEIQAEAKNFQGQLEAATLLVDKNPSDPEMRLTRAKANEDLGNLDAAVTDYRQAFALRPRDAETSKKLAQLLEKLNRPCEAAAAWAQLARWSRERRAEGQSGIHKVLTAGGCPDFYPAGIAEIEAASTETGGWYVFPVKINGQHDELLGVDSSSPYTLLTPGLANKLGIQLPPEELFVKTFVGTVRGQPVRLASVKLGSDLDVKNVDAVVVDQLPDGLTGMLGGDFLERVEMDRLPVDEATLRKFDRLNKDPPAKYRFAAKSSVASKIATTP